MSISIERVKKLKAVLERQRRYQSSLLITPSKQIELQYNRLLTNYVKYLAKLVNESVEKVKDYGYFADNMPFVSLFPAFQIEKQVIDYEEYVLKSSEQLLEKGQTLHRRQFVTGLNRVIGVDISKILNESDIKNVMENKINENVNLIKSISNDYLSKVENAIKLGIDRNQQFFSVKEELQKIEGVTKSRAKLIARDQTSKLVSSLNEERQKSLGVEGYTWRTTGDDSVRDSHRENDGKPFRWDSPPPTGHPGEDVNCRCIAEPDLSNLFALLNR